MENLRHDADIIASFSQGARDESRRDSGGVYDSLLGGALCGDVLQFSSPEPQREVEKAEEN
jgi:hypothetical protein